MRSPVGLCVSPSNKESCTQEKESSLLKRPAKKGVADRSLHISKIRTGQPRHSQDVSFVFIVVCHARGYGLARGLYSS